jgi:hypothetical protein
MNDVTGRRRKKTTHIGVVLEHVGGHRDGELVESPPIDFDSPLTLLDNKDRPFLEIHRVDGGIKLRIYMMPPIITSGGK